MEAELSKEQRTFEDGNVVLFKRANSDCWQARIRRFKGKWIDSSTKESDFNKAAKVASDKYKRMAWLQENNEVDVTAKFKDVAALTIKELEAELAAGTGKEAYKDYVRAIKNYLIPCFGNTLVHKIDHQKLAELDKFRSDKVGHLPNKSTITTHNTALNCVFKTAISKQYMLPLQVPQLKNKGATPKSRPYFSDEEYLSLARNLHEFAKTGHQQKTRDIRELLRDYVLILRNTGMRPGKEALSLKWKNIRWVKLDKPIGASDDAAYGLEFDLSPVIRPTTTVRFPLNLNQKGSHHEEETVYRRTDHRRAERA